MSITRQPYPIHPAYNTSILRVTSTATSVSADISSPQSALVSFPTISRNREVINGAADFNISATIKALFKNIRQPIGSGIVLDGNLAFIYDITADGSVSRHTVLNAVVQIGQSQDFTTRKGQFLTEFKRLRKYPGYPLSVAFIGNDGNTLLSYDRQTYIYEGDLTWNGNKYYHAVLEIPDGNNQIAISNAVIYELCDEQANIITNELGEIICVTYHDGSYFENILPIDNKPIPCSPFYVRWINHLGGYDHYMFSFRQKTELSVSDPVAYNPYIDDQENAHSFSKVIGIKATEKITVGAESVSNDDYIPLSKIIYSPRIEWYAEDIGKWIEIQVDKGSVVFDSRTPSNSLEISLLKPEIQTQF